MPIFRDHLELLTPFGLATCTERVDTEFGQLWICWPKETGICYWFNNQEVRYPKSASDGRYTTMPFKLDPARVAALDGLGRHHAYWRENVYPGDCNSG